MDGRLGRKILEPPTAEMSSALTWDEMNVLASDMPRKSMGSW